jgi:hypothetical protein
MIIVKKLKCYVNKIILILFNNEKYSIESKYGIVILEMVD